ncbi:MAG: hypothetical protein DHS20C15_12760 [Planctomycetota bacterium]|nr:MAG: hypothetical protein DHS20C15_12760 [Planctomycetota bacterium]
MHALLAARCGRASVEPGQKVSAPVDHLLLDGPAADLVLVGDTSECSQGRRLLIADGARVPRKQRRRMMRDAAAMGSPLPLDPQRGGFPEAVAVQEGFVGGGELVAAMEPSAGALGGLGSLALRVTPQESQQLLRQRKLTIGVPEVLQVSVRGRERRWCGPFDIALEIHARLADRSLAPGTVLELSGDWIAGRSLPARMSLCAHLARLGHPAVVPPDAATRVFLAARHRGAGASLPVAAPDPTPAPDLELEAQDAPLSILQEPYPGTRHVLSRTESELTVSDVVLVGDVEELSLAVEVLRERPLHAGLLLSVVPSDRRSLLHALEQGLLGTLLRCGAQLLPPGQLPAPARRGELRVVTRPTGAGDVLCGAAVAAVAAVTGTVMDPEAMRRAQQRTPPTL